MMCCIYHVLHISCVAYKRRTHEWVVYDAAENYRSLLQQSPMKEPYKRAYILRRLLIVATPYVEFIYELDIYAILHMWSTHMSELCMTQQKITGLFCKRALWKSPIKEPIYIYKEQIRSVIFHGISHLRNVIFHGISHSFVSHITFRKWFVSHTCSMECHHGIFHGISHSFSRVSHITLIRESWVIRVPWMRISHEWVWYSMEYSMVIFHATRMTHESFTKCDMTHEWVWYSMEYSTVHEWLIHGAIPWMSHACCSCMTHCNTQLIYMCASHAKYCMYEV